jgi:hypothetical protein
MYAVQTTAIAIAVTPAAGIFCQLVRDTGEYDAKGDRAEAAGVYVRGLASLTAHLGSQLPDLASNTALGC